MPVTEQDLRQKIESTLKPTYVEVVDVSDGCGQNYNVLIVSPDFEGKSLIQRHRLVNESLKDEIKQLHAFSQKCMTPKEHSI